MITSIEHQYTPLMHVNKLEDCWDNWSTAPCLLDAQPSSCWEIDLNDVEKMTLIYLLLVRVRKKRQNSTIARLQSYSLQLFTSSYSYTFCSIFAGTLVARTFPQQLTRKSVIHQVLYGPVFQLHRGCRRYKTPQILLRINFSLVWVQFRKTKIHMHSKNFMGADTCKSRISAFKN
jgi:hypothetical protein